MHLERREVLVGSLLVGTLVSLGVLINRASYELWGGLLLIPLLAVASLPLLRWFLRRGLSHLYPVLAAGFFLKMGGAILRFYVFSKIYGGQADSGYYYGKGVGIAAAVHAGRISFWSALPFARELTFMNRLTGTVLTFTGPTQLGAFIVFATFGYWGMVFLVAAGCRAVPGLDQRRYALLCCLAPTLVFWPSSIGKEAWILFAIGIFSLGVSRLLRWDRALLGLCLAVAGGLGIGAVRIHLSVVFVAGAAVAFVQGLVLQSSSRVALRKGRAALLTVAAIVVMAVLAYFAARRLQAGNPNGDFFTNVDSALNRASTLSQEGGSSYTPVSTKNPLLWPWAIFRTLTRPLPIDIKGVTTLLPAAETSLFLAALVVGYRRLTGLRRALRESPYLTYALVCTLLFGLVFSSFGNLGILVRQRSLVAAFLMLALCLPKTPSRAEREALLLSKPLHAPDQPDQGDDTPAAASRA